MSRRVYRYAGAFREAPSLLLALAIQREAARLLAEAPRRHVSRRVLVIGAALASRD